MAENPTHPIHPSRSLEQLTKAVESLRDVMVAQGTPNAHGRIQASQQSIASRQTEGVSMPPQWEAQAQLLRPGMPSSTASAPEIRAPSEIGPFELVKDMWKEKRGGRPIANALEKPKRSIPGYTPGHTSSAASRAPNIDVDQEMLDKERDTFQTGASRPPNAMGGGIAGGASGSNPSPIKGITQQQFGEMREEGFKIPQFGEWQLDTALKMARDWAGKASGQYNDNGDWEWKRGLGKTLGTASGLFNYGYAHAAQVQVARKFAKKVSGYGGGLSEAGSALGYSPQSGVGPSNIFGLRNPLSWMTSEAGRQGAGMNLDAYAMSRFGTGLSLTQSRQIYSDLAGMGFSNQKPGFLGMSTGGDLQNIATGLVAPMVKEGGSPEVAARFAEQLKTGTVSIQALANSLKNMSGYAKESHQTLDQARESIQQYASAAVGMGATPVQAYHSGMTFSSITGQNANVAAGVMGSPYFQAQAMGKYGVFPEAIGTLPGYRVAEMQLSSIEQLQGVFKGIPAAQRNAMIASRMGMTAEQVEQTLKNKNRIPLQSAIERNTEKNSVWNQAWTSMQGRARTRDLKPLMEKEVRKSEEYYKQKRHFNSYKHPNEIREEYEREEGKYSHSDWYATLSKHNQEILQKGGTWEGKTIPGSKQIAQLMRKEKGDTKDIRDKLSQYEKAAPQDKEKIANEVVQKRGEAKIKKSDGHSEVTIGLTPQAARALQVEGTGNSYQERMRNAGGPATTNSSVAPYQGP